MAFERYEVISPPAAELRQLIEQYRSPREALRITIVAHKIGLVKADQSEQVTFDVRLVGVLPGENGSRIYGEVGSNPVSTVDIAVSDAAKFPAVLTMVVPSMPEDI